MTTDMLDRLIRFSLDFRLVVLLLAVVLLVVGADAMRSAPWDVFPEFAPPQIVIQTEAPGLSTEEVEQMVTIPVESAVNGVSRIKTLRSSSVPGLSVVKAIFEEGTNILDARQLVNERLNEVATQLPATVDSPRMTPLAASTSRLLMIGLTSETASLMELRTIADWTLRRRLQAVRGVAFVEVFGGDVKQYQVLVNPQRLQRYNVSLDQVTQAARQATGFGGAGYVETPNQRLSIQQRTRIESPADLAAVPVLLESGVPISLGNVADVTIGSADKPGDATINGQPGVLLLIHKQPSFNTLQVSDDVQRAVAELSQTLPAGVELHPLLFRQASFIERAIGNLSTAILIGCGLVILILIAFLFQWRTVVISLTAIPLSLLGAILVLRGCGASLNAMTLGGLAIALGEVVDDAIVDVENVLRRLRENAQQAQPRPARQVVLDASLEVRSAVVYASFIVVLVFLPVFFMGGLAGTFFRPLGLAYISAILVSLGVALTVTPALCLTLLPGTARTAHRDPLLVRLLSAVYSRVLPLFLNFRKTTVSATVLLMLGALATVPYLGGEFLPNFRESNFVVFMAGKPEESLQESVRVGQHVANRLLEIPGVASVAQQIGRANLSEDTWGPNISEIWVSLDDQADYDIVLQQIRGSVAEVPGHVFQVKQFLRERIDEVLTGTTADMVIQVNGPDLNTLRDQAGTIFAAIKQIEGIADLQIEQQVDVPQIRILLRPQDAAQYGFSVGKLNQDIQTLLRGTRVGQVYEQDQAFDVMIRAAPEIRSSPTSLGRLLVDSPANETIPLEAVASIALVDGPNAINREQASRRLLVTCNAQGRDVTSLMEEVQQKLQPLTSAMPAGYHIEYGGEYTARSAARQQLLLMSSVALVGIFILLYLDLKSIRLATMVMLSVPLACVGGIAGVLLAGGDVSLGSLVGFVTVFGISVRNGILLISHYQHLQRAEGLRLNRELILKGASERLIPILMTASSTALALLPLILFGNLPGHEIEHPMAIVIVGGLISSTFLTLVLLPVLYEWIGRADISANS
ncbi:Cobalt-zinc-cadmium resistance protein CzcA [Gimesia panareensis]|uniref:Cobalt-zinc-cadmium resistance protein CzcA n=2 Tax=Gimesia panareensis TaxID=2527978 RepID=A0A518FIR5_9PLAN|nr:Cobalt-zinc-cadmium resistance protein CzcA [Gimesia panareensis]